MTVVDNDGALDLEEIEADENQTNLNNNDDTDLIEEYLTAPIFFKVYDPAIPRTFLVFIFCLFIIRYSIVPITTESYKQSRKMYITNKVMEQIELELISNLLLEIDSSFANLSGIV
ncbi:hypothetical protein TVAG_416310 [Trichomonas vaginalis G3]|uniref:Uncharacterized protein n=1 Tax=Trichomonas vaginalis (strain ATCC PRA-98 / G3) TaxID=412133 RepID=A2FQ62_TRIV3|eukprot:XP_001305899.1 hypothetical protein [Trichomonas vaginalis G3]